MWTALERKIIFEDPSSTKVIEARKIIQTLNLDLNDAHYIALCIQHINHKPVFWTYDTPFVFGEAANILRKQHKIFANFQVET